MPTGPNGEILLAGAAPPKVLAQALNLPEGKPTQPQTSESMQHEDVVSAGEPKDGVLFGGDGTDYVQLAQLQGQPKNTDQALNDAGREIADSVGDAIEGVKKTAGDVAERTSEIIDTVSDFFGDIFKSTDGQTAPGNDIMATYEQLKDFKGMIEDMSDDFGTSASQSRIKFIVRSSILRVRTSQLNT